MLTRSLSDTGIYTIRKIRFLSKIMDIFYNWNTKTCDIEDLLSSVL